MRGTQPDNADALKAAITVTWALLPLQWIASIPSYTYAEINAVGTQLIC